MSGASSTGAAHTARRGAIAFGLYAAVSLLVFGLPLAGGGRRILAGDEFDSSAFVWFIAWWPHALLHGLNPFVTHAIFYPNGFNLTWAASMPGPAIVLTPVTLAFGPVTTYNLIELAAPALDGWAMFLLCRELTGRTGPALVGGYLFGFSPYVLANLVAGPNLVLVWPLPLIVWLIVRRGRGTIGTRRFVIGAALLLIAQFLTAPEVLATGTVFGGIALVAAWALGERARVGALLAPLGLAYAAMVVLASPFLIAFFLGAHYPPGATKFNADLVSFVAPPAPVAVQLHAGPAYVGSDIQSYLGVPLVALVALSAWWGRRERRVRLLTVVLAVAVLAMLGDNLDVGGHDTGVRLPWSLARQLPVLRYAIPLRLAVFAMLAAGALSALGLARAQRLRARGLVPAALALAAIAFVFPSAGDRLWNTSIADPPLFATGAYHRYFDATDHVLTIPAWGPNERWVADAGFPFTLSSGYAGNPFPPAYTRYPTWNTLLTGRLTPDYAAQLRRFVAAKHVTAVLVEQNVPGPWAQLFGSLGVRRVNAGGMWLYRLRPRRASTGS